MNDQTYDTRIVLKAVDNFLAPKSHQEKIIRTCPYQMYQGRGRRALHGGSDWAAQGRCAMRQRLGPSNTLAAPTIPLQKTKMESRPVVRLKPYASLSALSKSEVDPSKGGRANRGAATGLHCSGTDFRGIGSVFAVQYSTVLFWTPRDFHACTGPGESRHGFRARFSGTIFVLYRLASLLQITSSLALRHVVHWQEAQGRLARTYSSRGRAESIAKYRATVASNARY